MISYPPFGRNNRNRFGFLPGLSAEYVRESKRSSVTPHRYAIELRDKDFNLKARLEPYITSFRWEWNRIGGCGRASFTITSDYKKFNISADDDIRVYLPNYGANTATLVYRGYVESVNANLSGSDENIGIECMGYFGWLERIIVQDSGSQKNYNSQEVSSVVSSLISTFVVPNSDITLGTIDPSNFVVDSIDFKGDAKECLKTLFDLLGDVEFGVDANLQFFWYNQNTDVRHKFFLGDKITKLGDKFDFKGIINSIYFEGGSVGGSAYTKSGGSTSSQNRYGKHEEIISNGSITTDAVANRYITGLLRQKARPIRQIQMSLTNTRERLEASLPIGAVSIIDQEQAQTGAIYGTTAAGGSNRIYGSRLNGGSNQLYGGSIREQVERISYATSSEDGRFDADIQFGPSVSLSQSSALLKQLEQTQNALRQRSL